MPFPLPIYIYISSPPQLPRHPLLTLIPWLIRKATAPWKVAGRAWGSGLPRWLRTWLRRSPSHLCRLRPLVGLASSWGGSVLVGAYLHPTLDPTRAQPGLRPCTRCSAPAMCPSSYYTFPWTGAMMPLLPYLMRLRRGCRTRFMAVSPPYLLYNNRFIWVISCGCISVCFSGTKLSPDKQNSQQVIGNDPILNLY